jgi:hypothetical protein
VAVEDFLIDSRYYKGGSLIVAFCNDVESLKGLLVCGWKREEIEAKLPGAIAEILTAGGAKVANVKVERYPGILPEDFVPGVFYGTAEVVRP